MRSKIWVMAAAVLGLLVLELAPLPLAGQGRRSVRITSPQSIEEGRLLRAAAVLEADKDLGGAEKILRELMGKYPTSVSGVLALERILRARDRVAEVLPVMEKLLALYPYATPVRRRQLRVLAQVDSAGGLELAAGAWIAADSGRAQTYQEIARIYEESFGVDRALEFLLAGTRALGDSTVLAIEIGDLYLKKDRPQEAIRQWSRAISERDDRLSPILSRVRALNGERSEWVRALLKELGAPPETLVRRRAAVRIAIETGLEVEAIALLEAIEDDFAPRDRLAFLDSARRRAEERRLARVALWGYETIRKEAPLDQLLSIDRRIATLALSSGDTLRAMTTYGRIADTSPPASSPRRLALTSLIELQTATGALPAASERIGVLRREFPESGELDELAATLAARYHARGERERALAVLEGLEGPRTIMERGYLQLAEGDLAGAAGTFRTAVAALAPAKATEIIALLQILAHGGEEGGRVAGEAYLLRRHGDLTAAISLIAAEAPALPPRDQPLLLALGARLADAGKDGERALAFRERLVGSSPNRRRRPRRCWRSPVPMGGIPRGSRRRCSSCGGSS